MSGFALSPQADLPEPITASPYHLVARAACQRIITARRGARLRAKRYAANIASRLRELDNNRSK